MIQPAPDASVSAAPPERGETSIGRIALFAFACGVPIDSVMIDSTNSVTVALGVALAMASMGEVLSRRRVRPVPPALLFLAAFAAWSAGSILWARDGDAAVRRMQTNGMLLAFVWLGWQIARSREGVRAMTAGYVLGCSIALGATVHAFLTQQKVSEYDTRYGPAGFDPNELGVTLAIGIPLAAHLALAMPSRGRRLWLAYLPAALGAIALSGSRGAALSAAVAIATTSWWAGRRSAFAALGILAFLAIGALMAWYVVPHETLVRIFTLRDQLSGGTFGDRLPIWRAALDVIGSHPLLGVGAGGFPGAVSPALGGRAVAHNTFLSVAAELGAVGAALFLGAIACAVKSGNRAGPSDRALVLSALATWAIGAASLTWEYKKVIWLLLLLAAAVEAAQRTRCGDRLA